MSMRPVLLVVDAQNGWLRLSEGLKRSVEKHLDSILKAISIFRKAGAPIIFTYHSYGEQAIVPGTSEFELFTGITLEPTDGVLVKTYANAFNKTRLEEMIRERGCDTVLIAGLSALHCVLSTYQGAHDHDLTPYLVRGAVAGPDEESVQLAERLCDTLSLRAVSQILGQDPRLMMG
ncbi:MAG: isochorismatase family cysteine hydrolase [Candidatus Verstraetearchaeota archaeon]|nr:isochorismatase family cysteine hydrolase [Candidatus Verstraetearchaeota archaeon]